MAEAKIEKNSSFKKLDNATLKGLGACKIKPATKDGKPEQAWEKVEYTRKFD